jgi:hypothetical protein
MSDRTIHATTPDGGMIVRYERAGKWYVEWPADRMIPRRAISLREAVRLATQRGAYVYLGQPGGRAFDAKVKAAV